MVSVLSPNLSRLMLSNGRIKTFSLSRMLATSQPLLEKQLAGILEPLFLNGLTNYSSVENKKIIEDIVKEYNLTSSKSIKRWIDRRKSRERKKQLIISNSSEKQIPTVDGIEIPLPGLITPLKLHRWLHYLQQCPLSDKQWVIDGIRNGFSLHCEEVHKLIPATRNLASAYSQPEVIDSYLENEIKSGTMFGPFVKKPFENAHINRFGVIPKSSGKWRLITDLSFPVGGSVNDGISAEHSAVSYTGLSAAIKRILRLGKGCLLAKFDLRRAYRLLAIKESERHLLVMNWKDLYYVDLALPFGARSAPQIFSRFSDVLEWILKEHGDIVEMQHSLDDFLICGPPNSNVCFDSLNRAFELCYDLGVEIEHSKTDGPSTSIVFLGLAIDTESMEIRIPDDKLEKIRTLLEEWAYKKSGTKRSLLSLIGTLFYCSQAVLHGRPFINKLVRRAYSVEHLYQKVTLSESEQEDIRWWFYLLNTWNGRSFLTDMSDSTIATKLHS